MTYKGQSQLTQKEKLYFQDQLSHEEVCLKKCDQYLNQVQDPQVQDSISQIRQDCDEKVQFLSSFLQQNGISTQS